MGLGRFLGEMLLQSESTDPSITNQRGFRAVAWMPPTIDAIESLFEFLKNLENSEDPKYHPKFHEAFSPILNLSFAFYKSREIQKSFGLKIYSGPTLHRLAEEDGDCGRRNLLRRPDDTGDCGGRPHPHRSETSRPSRPDPDRLSKIRALWAVVKALPEPKVESLLQFDLGDLAAVLEQAALEGWVDGVAEIVDLYPEILHVPSSQFKATLMQGADLSSRIGRMSTCAVDLFSKKSLLRVQLFVEPGDLVPGGVRKVQVVPPIAPGRVVDDGLAEQQGAELAYGATEWVRVDKMFIWQTIAEKRLAPEREPRSGRRQTPSSLPRSRAGASATSLRLILENRRS